MFPHWFWNRGVVTETCAINIILQNLVGPGALADDVDGGRGLFGSGDASLDPAGKLHYILEKTASSHSRVIIGMNHRTPAFEAQE
jgi:hypothetical protein